MMALTKFFIKNFLELEIALFLIYENDISANSLTGSMRSEEEKKMYGGT